MSEFRIDPIPNSSADWTSRDGEGRKWNGKAIQTFVRDGIKKAEENSENKIGATYFDEETNTQFQFKTTEDKESWLTSKDGSLVLGTDTIRVDSQAAIEDLDEIRSGAALGATALQSIPSEYITETELSNKSYATQSYVDTKISALVGSAPETLDTLSEISDALKDNKDIVTVLENSIASKANASDLDNYSLSNHTHSQYLTEHQDISHLATKDEIPSLTGYATESWVKGQNYLTEHQDISGKQDKIADLEAIRTGAALGASALQSIPTEYVTETELSSKGYLTEHQDISGKQDVIADLATIRANASKGASALQSIPSEYITETELTSMNFAKKADLTGYTTDAEFTALTEIVSNKADSSALSGYSQVGHVHDQYLTEHQDISGKQDVISDLSDIRANALKGSTALQSIPDEYITETELSNKSYATQSYVDTKVSSLVGSAPEALNTLEELSAALKNNKDIVTVLENSIASKANASDLDNYAAVEHDHNNIYYTESEVDTLLSGKSNSDHTHSQYLTQHQDISGKQDKISDLNTIRQNALKGSTALQSVPDEYITETELTAKGYATITQLNAKQDTISDLANIRANASNGDTAYSWGNHASAGYLKSVPAEYITDSELTAKGYASQSYVDSKLDEVFLNVSNGKVLIASAITDKGVYASDEETFQELSEKISLIPVGPPGSTIIGYIDDKNDIYISLSEVENGTYTLKLEDFNGILSDYYEIGTVEINDDSDSFKALLDCNVAPQEAGKIGLYDKNGNLAGTIPLYNYKKKQGTKLYSFGLISDLHIQVTDTYDGQNDLRRAFDFFTNKGINLTCCCGDIADTNTLQEYINFKAIKDQYPDMTFYSCTGNHDCSGANGYTKTYWNTYIGTDKTFEITHNGDHFLFIGMNAWDFKNGYTDQDLDWLEAKLNQYRNERSFVFIHCPIPQYVGNYKEMYEPNNWLTGSNLYRITEMANYYLNSVWFSGHSHWKWHLQKWEENANIYRKNTAWNVHIPSCAIPGDAEDDREIGRMVEENEGAIVDVYADYIEIKGIDFKTGKYIPVAQYRLDTTLQNIIDKDSSSSIKLIYSHATPSNLIGIIEMGLPYSNTFTVDEGYLIDKITVKMGGVDITSTVLTDTTIYIPNVTGDIEITVTVKQLEYLLSGQLRATDFALYSTDQGQTVTQDGNDIVFNFPTTSSAKFTWVAGNAVGDKYSQSTHIAVLEYDGVEYSQELSDTAKCYVGFIDLSGDFYTTDEEVPLSWSNSTNPTKGVQFNMSSRFAANGGSAPLTIRLINPRVKIRTPKKYSITQNLTQCTSSYVSTSISEMISKQRITFTPASGYVMSDIKVTMNGKELPYSYVDGNSIIIYTISGDINVTANAVAVVEFDGVNQIPLSVDHDGTIFNGVGYMTNKRVDYSTGDVIDAVTTVPNSSVTGFIPFTPGDILYFYRVPWNISKNVGEINILLYEEDKVTKVNNVNPSDFISRLGGSCPGIASDAKSCFIYFADNNSQMVAIAFNPNSTSSMVAKTKWIRITTTELLDEYSIISKNQPITDIINYNVRVEGENCSFTSGTSTIAQFSSFDTEVVLDKDCVLVSLRAVMNGQDVSGWYVSGNKVSIPYVYGNVVITANVNKMATEDVDDVSITYSKNTRLSQSSGNQTTYNNAVSTNRIDISRIPKPCYLDMTGVAWAANPAAVHNRIVYSIDLMCGIRSNGYTGTNGSTHADYNDGINITNIERHNDANTDITIKISDPGIANIAFSGYTGTDAAGDGFTGSGNMDDANIHIWYKPEESRTYDFTGNLLTGAEVLYNKRWSASSGTFLDSNGFVVVKVPMSVALGKQFKLTGFTAGMTASDGQPSTFYVQPNETSAGASIQAMKPLWDNANCVANGDGTYTVTVPNNDATTAHHLLFITLVVNNTGTAVTEGSLTNHRVEIL